MEQTKTGAVICKKNSVEKGVVYEALLFITEIPLDVKDDELQNKKDFEKLIPEHSSCFELMFRADILSTSNEIQEQYNNLSVNNKQVPEILFSSIH